MEAAQPHQAVKFISDAQETLPSLLIAGFGFP
jgi:hypothetical protein